MTAVQEPINQIGTGLIPPHGGGSLVNRLIPVAEIKKAQSRASSFPRISISSRTLSDVEMLAIGAFSPLEGFLNQSEYVSVVLYGRLSNGLLWPIPLCLAVDEETKATLMIGSPAALVYEDEIVAILHVQSLYAPNKNEEVSHVFRTNDAHHPGVAEIYNRPSWYVGGPLGVISLPDRIDFPQYNLTPRDTRRMFQQKNWKSVVGFQTRNPMHRGHEAITKKAMEFIDGLLIHPMVGETMEGDIPASVRMKCYQVLVDNYFPAEKVLLAANPAHMYFAGPREAILHAIVRQNYGCTHFIVGRDHAGVKSFYGPSDAQELMRWFSRVDLAIQPIFPEVQPNISGTQIREMLRAGLPPPPEMMRPEVSKILLEASHS